MEKAYIKGISYYLPKKVVTNEELVKEFPEWSVDKVAAKVGVYSRHIAASDETAGDMAEIAAKKLFNEYKISPNDIDFVLLCTQSPDYHLPSTACILQHKLGIPTSAGAFDYDLGCSGCVYGLAIAKGFIVAGIAKNILLITSETYSKYINQNDKSNRSIFGDGAAACLISTAGLAEIGEFVLGTDGGGAKNLIVKSGGSKYRKELNEQTIDEDGHTIMSDYLYMHGSAVFNFTLDVVPPMLEELIVKHRLSMDDIDYFIFHQANKFMLNTIRKVCKIPKEKFYNDLSKTGNTVSSTIFIALKDCLIRNSINKEMNVMVASYGVGLSWAGTVLKF